MTQAQRRRLGTVIRQGRLARSITLRAMARQIGVSPTYLSMVERGKTDASAARIIEIGALLGIGDLRATIDDA